jgi:hypothetical protein
MGTYRLLPKVGPHRQGGRLYKAGEEVESESDLTKIFPGKFVNVDEAGNENAAQRQQRKQEEQFSETHTPFDIEQTRKRMPAPEFRTPHEARTEEEPGDFDEELKEGELEQATQKRKEERAEEEKPGKKAASKSKSKKNR